MLIFVKCLEHCLAQLQGGHLGGCGRFPRADDGGKGTGDTVWGQRFVTNPPWGCWTVSSTLGSELGSNQTAKGEGMVIP